MKKKTAARDLAAVLVFSVLTACSASASAFPFVSLGLRGGLSIANQDFDSDLYTIDTKSRTGVTIGVFAEWLDLPGFSVITEASYVQKGMKTDVVVVNGDDPFTFIRKLDNRIDYLSLCVLPKYRISMGLASLYLAAGPRMDIKLGAASGSLYDPDEYLKDPLKDSTFGGEAALGVKASRFSAEIRYGRDFTSCLDSDLVDVKNWSLSFLVGIELK